MGSISLPHHKPLSVAEAARVLTDYYCEDSGHVFDLFDASLVRDGDRDKFEALDLLSLTTLNAGVTSLDLQRLWLSPERKNAEELLAAVPHGRVEHLPEDAIDGAAQALARVADVLAIVTGWKGTRVGKLLHRMRPGLAPIYDTRVGDFYPERSFGKWAPWYGVVMRQVRSAAPALQEAIDAIPSPAKTIAPVRAWDVLLWSLEPEASAQ